MLWSLWYRLVNYCRYSLWIVPFFAVILQQIAIRITERLDPLIALRFYDLGVNGTQAVLSVVSTMLLSFIVFTFSSMLVAIQVASGQLTPRVIAPLLLSNNVVRFSVGFFTFGFLYVTGTLGRTETNVNQLAAALSVLLGLTGIVCFLYLIDYAARLLRPISIMRLLGEQGLQVIDQLYPPGAVKSSRGPAPVSLPERPHQIIYHRGFSGIVLAINIEKLSEEARKSDCIIEFMPHVGDFVGVGEPLFQVYGGEAANEEMVRSTVVFGTERTMEQDPLFAFRILVDIGIKALSKAINDPTTAVLAIDQLHRLLRKVGRRHTKNEQIFDASGTLRVVWRTPNWEDFVHLSVAEIRFYGAENVQIARRLRAMLMNLIQTLPERRHAALRLELNLLNRSIDKIYLLPEDAATARVADSQGLGASGLGTTGT